MKIRAPQTPTRIEQEAKDDGLKRMLGFSAALHVLVFVAFAVRMVFYPSEPITLEDAVRVDIVGLPDKMQPKKELAPPPAEGEKPSKPEPVVEAPKPPVEAPKPAEPPKLPPKVVEAPKPPPVVPPKQAAPSKPAIPLKPDSNAVNLEKAKKAQESALAALKQREALQKIMEQQKAAQAAQQAAQAADAAKKAAAASDLIKGNKVSSGNALTGLARVAHNGYVRSLEAKVKSHWRLPGWMANANLSTRVRIYLDADGFVVKKQILRSSQDETFDDIVLSAIDASSPFEPPPDSLANILAVDGIAVEFAP